MLARRITLISLSLYVIPARPVSSALKSDQDYILNLILIQWAMERDLLGKVLETEREIQAKIDSERNRFKERIEKARKEAQERVTKEEAALREQLEKTVSEAEKIAKEEAAVILEAAVRRAENLRRLPDEALQKIVMKYLGRILPGGPIDRPNVKG